MKKTWKLHGRRKPYMQIGVERLPCYRCGQKAYFTWQICSDERLHRPLCRDCDIALNEMVLRWMGFVGWRGMIKRYRSRWLP